MIQFTAEVAGVETLNRAFNRVDHFISDLRSVWPAVAEEFYRIEGEQFQSEGARGASGKWKPLSTPYDRYKAERFPGETILRATGALEESLTNREALDAVFIAGPQELTLGTKVPYARMHHEGRGRLPARPVIAMSEVQKRRIQKAIQGQLVEFTRKAGFEVVEERAA